MNARLQDNPEKFLRLFGLMALVALTAVVTFVLLMLGLRALFGLLDTMPVTAFIYRIALLFIPGVVFISAYSIFTMRTARHRSKPVRMISYALFITAIMSWLYALITDMTSFLTKPANTVDGYLSFEVLFVSAHVACLFFTGVLQALSMEKEVDWRDRVH